MNKRVNVFANLDDPPVFTTKPRPERPVQQETIERIATENNFPSRQAAKAPKEPKRKPRTYRTGRNQQFNAKVTAETYQRFYKMADDKSVALGELMKQGLDALEAVDSLQKVADRRDTTLQEIVRQALDGLERAGASR